MRLSRGSVGLEANYAVGPGRNLKSSGATMSRCYSRKPLGYPSERPLPSPSPPPKYRQNDGSRRGGRGWGRAGNGGTVVFPKLGRKFAQLNGARCLPLVPLIVHESTTGVESKNKGNTSLVRLFFPHHARALLRRSSTLLLSPPPPLPSPPTQLG